MSTTSGAKVDRSRKAILSAGSSDITSAAVQEIKANVSRAGLLSCE